MKFTYLRLTTRRGRHIIRVQNNIPFKGTLSEVFDTLIRCNGIPVRSGSDFLTFDFGFGLRGTYRLSEL